MQQWQHHFHVEPKKNCIEKQKVLQRKKGRKEINKLLCTADSCQLVDINSEQLETILLHR